MPGPGALSSAHEHSRRPQPPCLDHATHLAQLQRYLPFWIANPVERMGPVLVTLVAMLIPPSRMLPPLHQFRVRSRIFRWYAQLRAVEDAIGTRPADEPRRELAGIESHVEHVSVPPSYADELYSLRSHIVMVGNRLGEPAAALPP